MFDSGPACVSPVLIPTLYFSFPFVPGAIELTVLAKVLQLQVRAIDIQTQVVHNFGGDAGYPMACFVVYDGIHYDPLVRQPGAERQFAVATGAAAEAEAAARALVKELHQKRAFTDLAGFSLRCLACQTPLKGQTEAQAHAKETGHTNFGEV